MDEQRYLISEASRLTGVEAHVLRYWEEELELKIPRNELGHRYYTEDHMNIFREIQALKEKGYQLKAIKDIIMGGNSPAVMTPEDKQAVQEAKMAQFQTVMTNIMSQALVQNNAALSQQISDQMSEKVMKEMNQVLKEKENLEEERYHRLDETLRALQKSGKARAEAAAAKAPVVKMKKKRRKFFH